MSGFSEPIAGARSGVAACLLDGLSNKETARVMGISESTVSHCIEALCEEWFATSTRHLIGILAAWVATRDPRPPAVAAGLQLDPFCDPEAAE